MLPDLVLNCALYR
jgi:hypothetical protein